jgi:hypothetical protein
VNCCCRDWGPGFAASGIHGAVELLAFDRAALKGAHVHQTTTPTGFHLDIEAELRVPSKGDQGTLTVEMPQLNLKSTKQITLAAGDTPAFQKMGLDVNGSDVELWWPIDMGKQPLYDLVVSFTPTTTAAETAPVADATHPLPRRLMAIDLNASATDEEAHADSDGTFRVTSVGDTGAATSEVRRRVGFRTVKLHEEPIQEAAANLLGKAPGWNNSIPLPGRKNWCKGNWNCGQWGWVNGSKWEFVSVPLTPTNKSYAGYPFPKHPGGSQPWWGDDMLGESLGTEANPEKATSIEGESFYFSVNGVPFYAKGSNIIPMNILSTNVTEEMIRKTMDLAITGRMNMLRVWGGGWYNPDYFYDYADEKGLLIWQETMFACAPYPRWAGGTQRRGGQQQEQDQQQQQCKSRSRLIIPDF